MKKFMMLMLGLVFTLGMVAPSFAADEKKEEGKEQKKKKKKKTEEAPK